MRKIIYMLLLILLLGGGATPAQAGEAVKGLKTEQVGNVPVPQKTK